LQNSDEVFVVGNTFSHATFPTTSPNHQPVSVSGLAGATLNDYEQFITHMNKDGSALSCNGSTFFGGSKSEFNARIAIDESTKRLYIHGDANKTSATALTNIIFPTGINTSATTYHDWYTYAMTYEVPTIALSDEFTCPGGTVTLDAGSGWSTYSLQVQVQLQHIR